MDITQISLGDIIHIFHRKTLENSAFKNGKIRLCTHHFSDNYLKGFHIYNKLDEILPDYPNIEFTYIGNYNKNYRPKNIKIISNAGGLNPMSMADEIKKILSDQSIDMKVAYIDGDNLLPRINELSNEADGSIPIEPVNVAAISERISPNKLLATITSN